MYPVITQSVCLLKSSQFRQWKVINLYKDITEFTTCLSHFTDTISQYVFIRRQGGKGKKDFILF